jgi:glycosyltransferase domain-containing protein
MPAALTMIIPTYRRPQLLRRLLGYLNGVACPFKVLIADSNEAAMYATTRAIVAAFPKLDLEVRTFDPSTELSTKLSAASDAVMTPYGVICADDDIIVPSAAKACVDFLERHRDFSSAIGHFLVAIPPDGAEGAIEAQQMTLRYPRLRSVDFPDPLDRVRFAFGRTGHGLHYAVFRREPLQRIYRSIRDRPFTLALEHTLVGLNAAAARNHLVDRFYGFKQGRASSSAEKHRKELPRRGTPISMLLSPHFPSEIEHFIASLGAILAHEGHEVEPENLRDLFFAYFVDLLAKRRLPATLAIPGVLEMPGLADPSEARLKRKLERLGRGVIALRRLLPLIVRPAQLANLWHLAARKGRSFALDHLLSDPELKFTLERLRQRQSAFHLDFAPAFETICRYPLGTGERSISAPDAENVAHGEKAHD